MAGPYSIGALAKAAGVPTTTVRYYERRDLLIPDARTRSSYRVYGEAALQRLNFIRAAQASGFTLEDIASLLELGDGPPADAPRCRGSVQAMIDARLSEVEKKMADLRRVRAVLKDAAATCRTSRGPCPVMAKLTIGNRAKNSA